MAPADKLLSPSGQSPADLRADVLVLGGGVMGLWTAVKAAQAGLSVVLVETRLIGSGASGGVLGALFPWMPDRWDAKKQFQFEALVSLPHEIAALEAETGLKANFRRSGRIIALPGPHLKVIAARHQADALVNWHQGENRFFWHVSDHPPVDSYIDPALSAGGYVHDTLAARVEPRALIAVLRAWLEAQPQVRIFEQAELTSLDAGQGRAEITVAFVAPHPSPLPVRTGRGDLFTAGPASSLPTDAGHFFPPESAPAFPQGSVSEVSFDSLSGQERNADPQRPLSPPLRGEGRGEGQSAEPAMPGPLSTHQTITFGHLIIAAGVDSFPLLQALLPPMPKAIGQGVKGQAALLQADVDPRMPVVFLDGIYVVPHENGTVAVGSTSENTYADPLSTDQQLDTVIAKARALVPALARAEVVERWAGIRPKAIGRDPMIGPVPGHANVLAMTGGFKISFGMAHRLADCVVDFIAGHERPDLPENFTVEGQLRRNS